MPNRFFVVFIIITASALTACATSTPEPTYELAPNEELHTLSWGVQGRFEELEIGTGNQWLEDFTGEAGNTSQRWRAALWLSVEDCPAAKGTTVHIGDTLNIFGYSVRVLTINDEHIKLALSGDLADAEQIAADCAAREGQGGAEPLE